MGPVAGCDRALAGVGGMTLEFCGLHFHIRRPGKYRHPWEIDRQGWLSEESARMWAFAKSCTKPVAKRRWRREAAKARFTIRILRMNPVRRAILFRRGPGGAYYYRRRPA